MNSYQYIQGEQPLLISMPHNASLIPDQLSLRMTTDAATSRDTDWFVDELYDFAVSLGVHIIKPIYSRYYIDLNRDPSGEDLYPGSNSTELCPTSAFDGTPLYKKGQLPESLEIAQRIEESWQPYHRCIEDTLAQINQQYGYAILLDAHSICSTVPRFFEGVLPDFNFGTNSGLSCSASLIAAIETLDYKPWTQVTNGRFKGGYITRHYGEPEKNIHALQLELSQRTYMDEDSLSWNENKANQIKVPLEKMVKCLLSWKCGITG